MQDTNIPRFIPTKCPVCNGFGSVKHGQLICGSCNGKGVIVIDQKTGLQVEQTNTEYGNKNNTY